MTPVRAAAAAAVLLLAVVLAGCSGGTGGTGTQTPPGPAPTSQRTLVPPSGASPGRNSAAPVKSRPPTTPAPASSSGDVNETVPAKPVTSKPPVKLDKSANPTGSVVVTLPSIKAVNAKGQGPGEVSGPALAVTVRVQNNGDKAVDLSDTVVNLTAANGDPGSMMTGSPSDPLPARVKPGKTVSGVYVFAVPKNQRDPITVEASINADVPVVVFRGTP